MSSMFKSSLLTKVGWSSGNAEQSPSWLQISTTPDSTAEVLVEEMSKLYWGAVQREVGNIILTLKTWDKIDYAETFPEEEDDSVHGFDTFLDQVSESTRRFAFLYGNRKDKTSEYRSYSDVLEDRAWALSASKSNSGLKTAVRLKLQGQKKEDTKLRRARLLLQSAGLLDIDKLASYRAPLVTHGFWRKPRPAQLTLARFDRSWMPQFSPLQCSSCDKIIRGINFWCSEAGCKQSIDSEFRYHICEDCFRAKNQKCGPHLMKHYKHCVLRETITPEISRKICHCSGVSRIDANGKTRSLFPVDPSLPHYSSVNRANKCGLLNLKGQVAEAKHRGILTKLEKREASLEKNKKKQQQKQQHKKAKGLKNRKSTQDFDIDYLEVKGAEPTDRLVDVADEDIPYFYRAHLDKYPFGNVHVALTFGPLIIENGVPGSKRGVLITSRDLPHLQQCFDVPGYTGNGSSRSLCLSSDRKLHTQRRHDPRRLKACMKQVIGGAFTGLFDSDLEQTIVSLLVQSMEQYPADAQDPLSYKEKMLTIAVKPIIHELHMLLDSRVNIFLRKIIGRLCDPAVPLRWNYKTNSCQTFCDALLACNTFDSMLAPLQAGNDSSKYPQPLYLMSFVCRPGSYVREKVKTKFDVPNGLTEEYILKFRYGRHDDADIIDTLQEYWHDWGAFGKHLYKNQDLFPWDCTEAYGRYPTTCNDCNIAKHVWSFPFDAWSIIPLHLQKDISLYPPATEGESRLTSQQWMRNRLSVLLAYEALSAGALAMAQTTEFRQATNWLHIQNDPKKDRFKLGGIHRAQPFSHHFENGRYQEYYIADWAHLRFENQVAAYEELRDIRIKLSDVGGSSPSNDIEDIAGADFGELGMGWFGMDLMVDSYVGDNCDPAPADPGDPGGSTDGGAGDTAGGAADTAGDGYDGDAGSNSGGCGGCGCGGCGGCGCG